ncbi:MAG: DUF1289 domain-containing protein [Rubripirellula sp.]
MPNSLENDQASSPCIGICQVKPDADDKPLCTGCFRTLDEIGQWSSLSIAQRQQVNQNAVLRKRQQDEG